MKHAFDDVPMPQPNAGIRDRIRYLITLSRHTQASFAKLTDTDAGYLSRVLSGKLEPGSGFINRVVLNLGVSKEWLETGRDIPFPKALTRKKCETEELGAPVYDVDVTAGCVPLDRMLTDEHIIGYVKLPGLRPDTPLVPVSGESMIPKIKPGSLLSIRREVSDIILWGEIYVVVLNHNRVVKYVRKHPDPDKIILHSANPAYDDIDVRRDEILAMYLVEGVFSYEILC